jgi:hypothetical protein
LDEIDPAVDLRLVNSIGAERESSISVTILITARDSGEGLPRWGDCAPPSRGTLDILAVLIVKLCENLILVSILRVRI